MVEQIQAMCDKRGTSFKALEKELEFGNGTIRRWDDNSPSVDKVLKVADYFEVSILDILGAKKEPTPKDELDNELVKLLVDLTPSELLQVSAYVAGLKANRKA